MVSTCKHNYSDSIQHSYTRHLPSVQNFRLGEVTCMLPKGYRASVPCLLSLLILTRLFYFFHWFSSFFIIITATTVNAHAEYVIANMQLICDQHLRLAARPTSKSRGGMPTSFRCTGLQIFLMTSSAPLSRQGR